MEGIEQFSLQLFLELAIPVVLHYALKCLELRSAAPKLLKLTGLSQDCAKSLAAPAKRRGAPF